MMLPAAMFTLFLTTVAAVPMPMPSPSGPSPGLRAPRALPTTAPLILSPAADPDTVLEFYKPLQGWMKDKGLDGKILPKVDDDWTAALAEARVATRNKWSPSPVEKRQAPLGYPSFPADIPSCYNCQQKYDSLSSCMAASSAFINASSIFAAPFAYIPVIKCACTDTFQAVYPQCVHCFQLTNQCAYLGTDPAGTGAPQAVTNMRNICALGSSILGHAQSANYPDYNFTYTPSVVPYYTDVTTTGAGYLDQSTGSPSSGTSFQHPTLSLFIPVFLACLASTIVTLA